MSDATGTGRTVVLTGPTSGLGRDTARELAALGWTVALAARDPGRAADVADEIAARGGRAVPVRLDLADLASVRAFPAELDAAGLPPVHALVANAGVQARGPARFSRDGFEETFAVNHLGHLLLVELLVPRLVAPARIVLVTSATHDPAEPTGMPAPRISDAHTLAHPPDAATGGAEARRRYTTSKLCNVLTTYELARRLPDGITVNAYDPGLMPGTGLARDHNRLARAGWRYVLPLLVLVPRFGVISTRRSAAGMARLVTDEHLDGVTGRYVTRGRVARSSVQSYDRAAAELLWRTSHELLDGT